MRSSLFSMYRGFRATWADGLGGLLPAEAALEPAAPPSGAVRVAGLSRLLAGGVDAAARCGSTLGLRPLPATMSLAAAETEAPADAWLPASGDERRAKSASDSDSCSLGAPRRKPRRASASGALAAPAFGALGSSLLASAAGTMGVPGEARLHVGLSSRMGARACG
jgi:hypothetical protein